MFRANVSIVTGGFGALGREVGRDAGRRRRARWRCSTAPKPPWTSRRRRAPRWRWAASTSPIAEAAAAAIDKAVSALGGLDALVNIAGAFRWETLADGDVATWDFLYAANVKTAVCASQGGAAASGEIRKPGASSISAPARPPRPAAGMGAYAASKAGVAQPDRGARRGTEDEGHHGQCDPALDHRHARPTARTCRTPISAKWVTPDEIADAIRFLLSDAARGVTGALIAVSGPRLN